MRAALLALLSLAFASACAAEPSPYRDWAVAVIAADWRDLNGRPIEAFDNARRDAASAYVAVGFSPENVSQASLRPRRAGDDDAVVGQRDAIAAFRGLAERARAGCLFHLTSHGDPAGVIFGPGGRLRPESLDRMLDDLCGDRPTVVVVSACFSGVFVPALQAPHRLVLTAARKDRSSFGCGENDRYPFFDQCVIEELPRSRDFLDLGRRAKACVGALETAGGLSPPSEPQTSVGAEMQTLLPLSPFRRAAPAG